MKQIIILLIVFVLGLSLGYMGNTLMALRSAFSPSASSEKAPVTVPTSPSETSTDAPTVAPKEPVAVPVTALTDGQKALLSKIGIDPTKFVVTPGMAKCAEDTLGPARIAEILAGGTPSPLEAARLSPCLNK